MKGSGIPVRGSKSVWAERFIMVCAPKKVIIAPPRSFPKVSGAFIAILNPNQTIVAKIRTIKSAPIKPVSSATIANIESVVLSGR